MLVSGGGRLLDGGPKPTNNTPVIGVNLGVAIFGDTREVRKSSKSPRGGVSELIGCALFLSDRVLANLTNR